MRRASKAAKSDDPGATSRPLSRRLPVPTRCHYWVSRRCTRARVACHRFMYGGLVPELRAVVVAGWFQFLVIGSILASAVVMVVLAHRIMWEQDQADLKHAEDFFTPVKILQRIFVD